MSELWNNGWPLFLLGLWIGAPFGMLVLGLCMAARRNNTFTAWDVGSEQDKTAHSKAYYDALDAVSRTHLEIVKGD